MIAGPRENRTEAPLAGTIASHVHGGGNRGAWSCLWVAALWLAGILFMAGCSDEESCISCVDRTPPAVPTGVFSVTGDRLVTVFWNDLYYDVQPRDLEGYVVYRSTAGPNGPFYPQAEIRWDENFDSQTGLHWYDDFDVANGTTYDYAVSSFDQAGNESELSFEEVFDTPRPEGFDLELISNTVNPALSGFDFSLLEAGRVDPTPPTTADILVDFEEVGGGVLVPFVQVARPDNVRLQDYGTIPLLWVDWAPEGGYSETGKAELILGHSYIVEISDSPTNLNYAKFEVKSIGATSVVMDWAYQPVNGSPELKAPSMPDSPLAEIQLLKF